MIGLFVEEPLGVNGVSAHVHRVSISACLMRVYTTGSLLGRREAMGWFSLTQMAGCMGVSCSFWVQWLMISMLIQLVPTPIGHPRRLNGRRHDCNVPSGGDIDAIVVMI